MAVPVPVSAGDRLRVAIVAESFLPSTNGVARSVVHVADQLRRRGHHLLLVAPAPGPDHWQGVPVLRVRSMPLPLCREFPLGLPGPTLRRALREFGPDLVHLASPFSLGAQAIRVARDLEIPCVAVYQTDVAGFVRHYGLGLAAGPVWSWLRHLHAKVDRTLAPSRAAVTALGEQGIDNVHRWARGVDTCAFSPAHRGRPATELVLRVRIGYVGRLAAEKRVDRLAGLQGLPGVELVIVGDGAERRRLERLLPQARFTGQLSGDPLSQAYADLDVFVHTGDQETFCQAAQEAQAAGVPVVAPAAGGLLDLVEHGTNGLLWRLGDRSDLSRQVGLLVEDPQLRKRMGRAARAGVAARTWDHLGDELLDHYHAVLPRGRTRVAA